MRICNREEFLKLPEGTLYCKGVRWAFSDISVKHETLVAGPPGDWVYRSLNGIDFDTTSGMLERYDLMESAKVSFPINASFQRDAMYEEDEVVFLVYEEEDLRELKDVIAKALTTAAAA